ncbi:MAG: cytochrome c3 family protein [Coriobacteriales bacterium]
MASGRAKKASTAAAVIVLLVVIVAIVWIAYGQFGPSSEEPAPAQTSHPAITASQSCTSCKAPLHDYVHATPYTGSCERCHSVESWRQIRYTHARSDFNVSFHAIIGCSRCHTEGEPNPAPGCQSCHFERSKHGVGKVDCRPCHTAIAWSLPRPMPREHLSLKGGHASLSCFKCHTGPRDADAADRRCVDCHGPNHGGLTTCEDCHEPARGWKPKPGFDHSAFFPLKYNHARADCGDCHKNGRFAGTPSNCSGCHPVVHTNLTQCEKCHTPAGFSPSTFDHAAYFPITGRHTRLDCSDCHKRGSYNGTPTWCSGCHGSQHGGLTACAQCHTTAGFRPAKFNHSDVFALKGVHATLACNKCHPGYRYASNISDGGRECSSCHDGPHGASYSACANCHTTDGWVPTKPITHPGYIQLGAEHKARSCRLCHPTLVFEAPTKPCVDCHLSTVPHVGPTDCLRCHRPTTWSELHFTHPELGIHEGTNLNQQCEWCHPGPDFTQYDCKTCHIDNGIPMEDLAAATGARWLTSHR